ncbi:MAG: Flp pilus assembly complex ATPase component TadA [Nanoarchaeota archaeon]|nr:Flp pilus assembly complex ATPase component TadA [Nanoarchaeota archaeon]MBU1622290.1 Flp pilus assembly complex ATPase component TadA [Nanoarchaeota archaeon]
MQIENYFDRQTMSVHLRENAFPMAKKGIPGNWQIVKIRENKLTLQKIKEIAQEIFDNINLQEKSFLEIERESSSIIQLGIYRIVITRKPFSDGFEITAVRPVAKLNFADYELDEKLKTRLTKQAEGILIAGSPGEGKTTFARALAEFFAEAGRIVKTVESPRDMLLSDNITQYSLNYGARNEIHDVLLLSRPDNTFFDEMRNCEDFQLFADLRLAGIGMVGVIHATKPIDAIQRFIGKIEMGIIPQMIDTVVFVKNGEVNKILELKMLVKVPTGMIEADLARPVIEIRDYISGKLDYEIYSYGEQTVVIPIEKKERKIIWQYAAESVRDYFKTYDQNNVVQFVSDNEIRVYLMNETIPKVIGKNGEEIKKIEQELGLKIDVLPLSKIQIKKPDKQINFEIDLDKRNVLIYLEKELKDTQIGIYEDEQLLVQAKTSKKAVIKLSRKSIPGMAVERAFLQNKIKMVKV